MSKLIYFLFFLMAIPIGHVQAQSYCAISSDYPWEEWIARVEFGDLDNSSIKFKDYNTLGYSNFTNETVNIDQGESVNYRLTLGNSGASVTMNWGIWIDFNQDGDFTDAGEQVGQQQGGTVSGSVAIPANAQPGTTRMRVVLRKDSAPSPCADFVRGEVEDYTIVIAGGGGGGNQADLTLANFNLPGSARTNSVVDFSVDLINQGSGIANGAFEVGVYLSTDNNLSNNDQKLSQIPTADFGPGFQVNAVPGAFNLAGIAAGSYYIILKIDGGNTITESNESNNIASRAFTVTSSGGGGSGADLSLTNFSVFTPDNGGFRDYEYSIDIQNNGNSASGAFNIKLFLSVDNTLSSDDREFNNIRVASIGAGQTRNLEGSETAFSSAGFSNGEYFLIVQADAGNEVNESDESNNQSIRPFTRVGGGFGAVDLLIENLRQPNVIDANSQSSLTIDIRNAGTIDANKPFRLTAFLKGRSFNRTATIGSYEVTSFLRGLDGVLRDVNFPIDVSGLSPGSYELSVSVSGTPFNELVRNNNTIVETITIGTNGYDDQFSCSGSILSDGGFESGIQNWGVISGNAQVSSDARTGSNALEICSQGAENGFIGTSIAATGASSYTLYFYSKNSNSGTATGLAYLIYFDNNFQRLSTGIVYINFNDYRRYALNRTAPAGTVYVGVQFLKSSPLNECLIIDDVCVVAETNSPNCSITATSSNVRCTDSGTSVNQLDDQFAFDFQVNGTNTGSGYFVNGLEFIQERERVYGENVSTTFFGDVQAPSVELTIIDMGNPDCRTTLVVDSPGDCSDQSSGCENDVTIDVSGCDDNGTPNDPRDDTFTLSVLATGTNLGSSYTTNSINGVRYTGFYNTPLVIGPLKVYNAPFYKYVSVRDSDSNSPCFNEASYENPLPCSFNNPIVCPGSIAINGNFEQNLTGWTVKGGSSVNPANGLASVTNTGIVGKAVEVRTSIQTGLFNSFIAQRIAVREGDEIEMSWNARRKAGTGGGSVGVSYYDSSGEFIRGGSVGAGGIDGEWTAIDYSNFAKAPAGSVEAEVYFNAWGGGDFGNSTYEFDNICYNVIRGNGGGGNGVDLDVNLSVDNTAPSLWQNVTYTLTVSNTGNQNASGVVIDFNTLSQLNPKKLAYVSQTDPAYDGWNGQWQVGSVAAGSAKTFDITLFVMAAAAPSTTISASVASLNQSDINAANNSASATITIPSSSVTSSSTRAQNNPSAAIARETALKLSILTLFPNPAQQSVTVMVESREAWAGAPVQIFDARGALVNEHLVDLDKGVNQLQLDVSSFTEGIYMLMIPNGNNQQKAMKRFVKIE